MALIMPIPADIPDCRLQTTIAAQELSSAFGHSISRRTPISGTRKLSTGYTQIL
jgi:hypothetical protein